MRNIAMVTCVAAAAMMTGCVSTPKVTIECTVKATATVGNQEKSAPASSELEMGLNVTVENLAIADLTPAAQLRVGISPSNSMLVGTTYAADLIVRDNGQLAGSSSIVLDRIGNDLVPRDQGAIAAWMASLPTDGFVDLQFAAPNVSLDSIVDSEPTSVTSKVLVNQQVVAVSSSAAMPVRPNSGCGRHACQVQ